MKPIKVKLRELFEELKCPHKEYKQTFRYNGYQEFIDCECEKCGKSWVEKI